MELLHERPVGLVDAARLLERRDGRIGELGGHVPAGGERGLALEKDHLDSLVLERHTRSMHAQADEIRAHGRLDDVQLLCKCTWEVRGCLPSCRERE